jgi:hypothetical protein
MRGRMNERDYGEGVGWMDFIYLHKIEQKTSCNSFKWAGEGMEVERQCG